MHVQNEGDVNDSTHTVMTPGKGAQTMLDVMQLKPRLHLRTFSDFEMNLKEMQILLLKVCEFPMLSTFLDLLSHWWRSTSAI